MGVGVGLGVDVDVNVEVEVDTDTVVAGTCKRVAFGAIQPPQCSMTSSTSVQGSRSSCRRPGSKTKLWCMPQCCNHIG